MTTKAPERTIEERYRLLSDLEHVLTRPGRYLGSTKPHTVETWLYDEATKKMSKREATYNPGLVKMFDEIVSNSVDHSKRPDGKHLDSIRVEVDLETGEISCWDNGGIPVVMHKEHNMWVPEMIFGQLRAGENFNDEDESMLTGQNGEGSSLTNIFSKRFRVETADGKKRFLMTFSDNNRERSPAKITPLDKKFTRVSYIPDYERLECSMDVDNYAMILRRVVEIAGTNPHLKVYFNGERIHVESFRDYVAMFVDEFAYDDQGDWKVAVAHSDEGFQHLAYVNTSNTKQGGTHIDYVTFQVCNELREHFKKKHKIEVKPSEIRNHLMVFIDAAIVNPRYSSQTKDELITEVRDFKTSWKVSEKLIQKILKSHIIQSVLDWVNAKLVAREMAQLREMNKEAAKSDPRKVEKFTDASEKRDRHKCMLFATEGDSARLSIQSGRGKNPYIGSMSLRGKPLNVRDCETERILANEEIKKMLIITGLKLGEPVRALTQLRFGKIIHTGDADVDGNHINGLLINLWAKFWPELFDLGVIWMLRTPIAKVFFKDGTEIEFLKLKDFEDWCDGPGSKKKGWKSRYYKGLGTHDSKSFSAILSNLDKYLVRLAVDDAEDLEAVDLAFSCERADDRKEWLLSEPLSMDELIREEK